MAMRPLDLYFCIWLIQIETKFIISFQYCFKKTD